MFDPRASFMSLVAQDCLAAEPDLVAVYRNDLHEELVALLEFLANILDTMLGHFADVQQAVRTRENLDERSELRESHHLAEVGFAELCFSHQVLDDLKGLVGGSLVGGGYVDLAVVFHVDLHSGLLDNASDHLAARSDQLPDLLFVNPQGVHAGRKGRDASAWFGQNLQHLPKDVQAPRL